MTVPLTNVPPAAPQEHTGVARRVTLKTNYENHSQLDRRTECKVNALCVLAESDNETTPTSTPEDKISRSKSQELLLLEKIQAESAAYYSYDESTPPPETRERKIVRTNLSVKYEKISLDEISGTKQSDGKNNSLDFKVLSLDEIRARKKVSNDTVMQSTPITLNLSRKRKLSTHESITNGGKVIKVVRNNSIVYKKVDNESINANENENEVSRKRSYSEQSEVSDVNDEMDCFKFKKIKLSAPASKPNLVSKKSLDIGNIDLYELTDLNKTDDSDSEVQIIGVEKVSNVATSVIDLDLNPLQTNDVIDLSDDVEDGDCAVGTSNVPDVVASCVAKNVIQMEEKVLLNDIDDILNDEIL